MPPKFASVYRIHFKLLNVQPSTHRPKASLPDHVCSSLLHVHFASGKLNFSGYTWHSDGLILFVLFYWHGRLSSLPYVSLDLANASHWFSSSGCYKKGPQTRWLKKQHWKLTVSQCWRLDVQNQGIIRLRTVREGPVPGLSPWLVDGCLLPISLHCLFSVCVQVQISNFKNISPIVLEPTLMISSELDYFSNDPISK